MSRQRVTEHGPARKYWTQVPNLIDDSDLDPYARALYLHYLRIAGQRETCVETLRDSAAACRMSHPSVMRARQQLVDGGWIEIEDVGSHGRGADQRIHLMDRWGENMEHYATPRPADLGIGTHSTNSPPDDEEWSGENHSGSHSTNSAVIGTDGTIPLNVSTNSISPPLFKEPEEEKKKEPEEARVRAPESDQWTCSRCGETRRRGDGSVSRRDGSKLCTRCASGKATPPPLPQNCPLAAHTFTGNYADHIAAVHRAPDPPPRQKPPPAVAEPELATSTPG